ncbi:MAG: hypothetical protein Q9213_007258 [Squamulea squamosa]
MSFPDTSSDPFFAPFNFVMDYDGLLPGRRSTGMPLIDNSQLPQESGSLPPSMDPSPSSWASQGIKPSGATTDHLVNTPRTRIHEAFNAAAPPLQSQNLTAPDCSTFPQSSKESLEFEAFCKEHTLSLSQQDSNQPVGASTAIAEQLPVIPSMYNSPGTSCGLSTTSNTGHHQQQGTNFIQCQEPQKTTMTCIYSHQSCLSSALDALQALHIPPTACLSSLIEGNTSANKRQPRKTDSVLAMNRTSVQRLSKIFKCSCIYSSQVQLILVIICDKLITWYRAVLHSFLDRRQNAYSNPDENATKSVDTSHVHSSVSGERVLYQSFAVGNCSFDPGLESKIFAQIIGFELQQLESVICTLDNRLRDDDISGLHSISKQMSKRKTSAIDVPGLSSSVSKRLTTHLLKKLEEIKSEIARDK